MREATVMIDTHCSKWTEMMDQDHMEPSASCQTHAFHLRIVAASATPAAREVHLQIPHFHTLSRPELQSCSTLRIDVRSSRPSLPSRPPAAPTVLLLHLLHLSLDVPLTTPHYSYPYAPRHPARHPTLYLMLVLKLLRYRPPTLRVLSASNSRSYLISLYI